jgi:hypothetical protein
MLTGRKFRFRSEENGLEILAELLGVTAIVAALTFAKRVTPDRSGFSHLIFLPGAFDPLSN